MNCINCQNLRTYTIKNNSDLTLMFSVFFVNQPPINHQQVFKVYNTLSPIKVYAYIQKRFSPLKQFDMLLVFVPFQTI